MIKKLGFSLLLLVFLLPGDLLAACASSITVNTDVTDIWEVGCTSEHRDDDTYYAKYYTFTLTKRQSVIIDLESSTDTYLYLLHGSDETAEAIAEDDNSGTGNDSQIVIGLPRGTYTIEATTFLPSATGEFDVSIDASDSFPGDCSNSIGIDTNESGTWVAECESEHRDDRYAKYYTFTLASSQVVTIDLESSTNTYLFLLNGSGQTGAVIAEDDDGGTGNDSQIVRILSAGTYTVEATTFASARTGTFVVSVTTSTTCTDCPFQINSGLNDAWFNTATNGQGFTIIVFPEMKEMWVAWFTYDIERPPDEVTAMLGDPGHRWLTAQGPYDEDKATLTIYVTEGGVFDSPVPATSTDPAGDGTLVIEFVDCTEALATYEITSLDISGVIPLERIVSDNVPLCEVLAKQIQ